MDNLIKRFDWVADGDLALCEHRGVAYQRDMKISASYDANYLAKCKDYDPEVSGRVNAGRLGLISDFCLTEGNAVIHARKLNQKILDIGVASGDFFRAAEEAGYEVKGYDIIPQVAEKLRREGKYSSSADGFDIVTMWDTIEHMEHPGSWLKRIPEGTHLAVSVPIFESLRDIRKSKHYRPGEHLYYWTDVGFVSWMALRGYRLLMRSDHEIDAGREQIGAYLFRRDLPTFKDYISMYAEMHNTGYYGNSATELHLEDVAEVVRAKNPKRILDYGCGRSDLVTHFWLDGAREVARYDPAIVSYKHMPEGRFDLVLCCDVMEHIPMSQIERVLKEIKAKSDKALFTISTKPARARLPNGENAHITLLTKTEWVRWIGEIFGKVRLLPSKWEHELLVFAQHVEPK